jgi:Ig-like domain CHU_C associated/Secretion system C-terminal sorting domain
MNIQSSSTLKKIIISFLTFLLIHIAKAQNNNFSVCFGKSATITGSAGQVINLYTQLLGGTLVGSGISVTTNPLISNTTYYLGDASNALLPRIPIVVAVNPLPSSNISSSSNNFCLGKSSTLTATTSSSFENKINFSGVYGLANSVIKNNNTNGGIDINFMPDSLILVSSSDNGSGNPGYSEYAFRANASGTIKFNWYFTCLDGSIYDYPTIAINNGVFNYLNGYALSSSIQNQRGSHTQTVMIGDTVRLRIETVDNLFASGKCVISGLIAPIPATVSVDWYSTAIGGTSLGNGNTYTATPTSSGSKNYYAESVSSNGCTSATRVLTNLNVYSAPIFSINGPSSICPAQTVTLNAIGNNNFVWSNGVINGIPFSPAATNTYKLIATTSNGCKDSAFKTVVLNNAPNIAINTSAPSGQVCAGTPVTLSGTGANSYVWNNGITNAVAFTPVSSANYILTGTDSNGCSNSIAQFITVNALPNVIINSVPSNALVCAGSTATLTASGASTYNWSGGIINGQAFTPSGTVTYTVTATDLNGCVKAVNKTVSVTSLPNLSISSIPQIDTICSGSNMTLFGNGAANYVWSNSIINGTVFNPTITTTYTLTGTGANGCSTTLNKTIVINTLPIITINSTPTNTSVCSGTSVILSAFGANTYTWSGGITNNIAFNASSTINYSVTGTDLNGCSNSASQIITVKPKPIISINANPVNAIVCAGLPATLTATGAVTYNWNNNVLNAVSFIPNVSGTYVVNAIGANGCTSSDSLVISIQAAPSYSTTVNGNSISANQANANYQWLDCNSNLQIPSQINQIYTPSQNGAYAVIVSQGACTDTSACVNITNIGIQTISDNDQIISIFPNPNNGAFTIQSKTKGEYVILNELGQTLQTFQTNGENNYSVNLKGLANGIYFLKGKNGEQVVNEKIILQNL